VRSRTRLTCAGVAALLLAGCGQGGSAAPQAVPAELAGHIERLQPGSLTGQAVATAQQQFGLALMAKVCGKDGPNTLISPASAADALGMLDAAAQGATASSVSALLHLPTWGPSVVAAVHDHRLAMDSLATGKGDTLRTSNRVWPAIGNQPTAGYLDDVRTAYGATLKTLDFQHDAAHATDTINQQVGTDTDGLIPKLFDQTLDPSTSAVLTNAIVLKALWQEPFLLRPAASPFNTGSGTSQTQLMDSASPVGFAETGDWQAAQIPYVSGTLAAVAILPPPGSPSCTLPSAAQLKALTTRSRSLTDLAMPRLHLDQSHQLMATLTAMGLPGQGDYSRLGGSEIDEVVQKDVMTVDELGTVAAGATGIAIGGSAIEGVGPTRHVVLNRPFLLLLEDVATHTPLFLASVRDPSAA
jgi:serpin B